MKLKPKLKKTSILTRLIPLWAKTFITLFIFSSFSFPAYSHPGRTASDGCHYCRTNCKSWGVPYGARHCHLQTETKDKDVVKDIKKNKKSLVAQAKIKK